MWFSTVAVEFIIEVLDDQVQSVKRWLGEEFHPNCLRKALNFPQNIMVWGNIMVCLKIVECSIN